MRILCISPILFFAALMVTPAVDAQCKTYRIIKNPCQRVRAPYYRPQTNIVRHLVYTVNKPLVQKKTTEVIGWDYENGKWNRATITVRAAGELKEICPGENCPVRPVPALPPRQGWRPSRRSIPTSTMPINVNWEKPPAVEIDEKVFGPGPTIEVKAEESGTRSSAAAPRIDDSIRLADFLRETDRTLHPDGVGRGTLALVLGGVLGAAGRS